MAVAASRPGRVAALVLVDPPTSSWEMPWTLHLLRAPVVGELAGELACRPLFDLGFSHVLFASGGRVSEETVDVYWRPITVTGTRRAALAAARSNPAGLERIEAGVRVPTLVLWGMQDPVCLPGQLDNLHDFAPDAVVVRIEDAGHRPMQSHPVLVNRAIRDFLGRPGR